MVTEFKGIESLLEKEADNNKGRNNEKSGGQDNGVKGVCSYHGNAATEQDSFEKLYRMFPVPGIRFKNEVFEKLVSDGYYYSLNSKIPAGYTYFGQFISHDISHLSISDERTSGISIAINSVDQLASPSLDLDSLYGDVKKIGCHIPSEKCRFTSQFTYKSGEQEIIYDIPRDEQHSTISYLIGDARNDENYLTAQIHVMFMNMHNRLMDIHINEFGCDEKAAFEKTRKEITLLYQQIVMNDFLKRVMEKKVYRNLFQNECFERLLKISISEEPRIPVEFSAAAMRFGHSMVLHEYKLNKNKRASLSQLLRLTGKGGNWREIQSLNHIIQWELFFDLKKYTGKKLFQKSSAIDPEIDVSLKKLELEENDNDNLGIRNLKRGKQLNLPSGQAVVEYLKKNHKNYFDAMGLERVDPRNVDLEGAHAYRSIVNDWRLFEKMPLWSYLLMEPYFLPKLNEGERVHEKLGVLGSIIVGEVFKNILLGSRTSIYRDKFEEKNSAFCTFFNSIEKPVAFEHVTMADLVYFTYYNSLEKENLNGY